MVSMAITPRPAEATEGERVSGAIFSDDRTYRYLLWRSWSERVQWPREMSDRRWLLFIMLNPSTADETANDPTVERCERRAREYGFAGLIVANCFALRSTDPRNLTRHGSPRGPDNDAAIVYAAGWADQVVCAWGTHARLFNRGIKVLDMLKAGGFQPTCLALAAQRTTPVHPLYVPYDMKPVPFSEAPSWPIKQLRNL